MSKHTQGPWATESSLNDAGSNRNIMTADYQYLICQIYSRHNDGMAVSDTEELSANARLIAASPELLAALQELLPILQDLDSQREEGDEEMPIFTRARAAIAKATGEKS